MSGAGVTVTIDSDQLQCALVRIERVINDPTSFWKPVANYLENATRERFASTQAPDGSTWKPSIRALNHATMGGSPQTLNDTGRLKNSMASIVNGASFQFGTNSEYAAIHQFGGTINHGSRTAKVWRKYGKDGVKPKFVKQNDRNKIAKNTIETEHSIGSYSVTMPARPFLGINTEDEREIEEIAIDWLRIKIGGQP